MKGKLKTWEELLNHPLSYVVKNEYDENDVGLNFTDYASGIHSKEKKSMLGKVVNITPHSYGSKIYWVNDKAFFDFQFEWIKDE